jgi:hypothetical protein
MSCGTPPLVGPLTPPFTFSNFIIGNAGLSTAFFQFDSNDFFGNGLFDDNTTVTAFGNTYGCPPINPALQLVSRNRVVCNAPFITSLNNVIIGPGTTWTGRVFLVNGASIPAQADQVLAEFLLDYDLQFGNSPVCDGWAPPTGECGVPGQSVCYPLSQAILDVASRLSDLNLVHWTSAEIQRYLVEALRTYNALTQTYRNRATFTTAPAAAFYDMPTVIPALRAYNVTDRDLVLDIQYSVMEPPNSSGWSGTSMFNFNEVVGAIQRRTDQFIRETGAVVTRAVTGLTPDANGRVVIPSNVISIRRAAWIMANGTVIPLVRDDSWSLQKYNRAWQTAAPPTDSWPTVYSVSVNPPLSVQLAPPPSVAGTLELLAVVLSPTFNPAVSATLLGVPDDWTWVVKFGALADLFGMEGVANDPARAKHCQDRWTQGIELATQASVLLDGFIAGAVTQVNSVTDVDMYQRTWQTTLGAPARLLTTAQNIVGCAPPPDTNGGAGYVVTVDVVANMPVPVNPTDCINLGIDDSVLDSLYDYAEYLAMVKEGAGQLNEAVQLLQRFFGACGVTMKLDQADVPNRGPMLQQTVQEMRVNSYLDTPEATETP